jgi:hypothetical protein
LTGCSGFRFVLSHPLDRKKSKGWSTEIWGRLRDFDAR